MAFSLCCVAGMFLSWLTCVSNGTAAYSMALVHVQFGINKWWFNWIVHVLSWVGPFVDWSTAAAVA